MFNTHVVVLGIGCGVLGIGLLGIGVLTEPVLEEAVLKIKIKMKRYFTLY